MVGLLSQNVRQGLKSDGLKPSRRIMTPPHEVRADLDGSRMPQAQAPLPEDGIHLSRNIYTNAAIYPAKDGMF